ncbi:MAG: Rpn family recombination-promoting nuclease/putative transposase [Bacteroidota bacterium]
MSATNPHDSLFKSTFQQLEIARTYLQHFLPPELVAALDLSQLSLDPDSYISPELEAYYSDIVYRCKAADAPLTLALLFEHKSYPERFPHIQLLRYMLGIWDRQLNNKEPLSLVVPMIVYHGKKNWQKKPFETYFPGLPEVLRPFLPAFDYQLTDLSTWSDEALFEVEAGLLAKTFFLFKHYQEERFLMASLGRVFKDLDTYMVDEKSKNLITSFVVYLWKTSSFSPEQIRKIMEQLPPKTKEIGQTTYDWIREGGKEEGALEKEIQIIMNSLKMGMPIKQIAEITGLSVEQLKARIEKYSL